MGESVSMQVEREFAQIYERCQPFTMADLLKCHNLYTATRYVIEHNVPGALVECGVWRGGCSMIMATVAGLRKTRRDIYLYDTFAGMTRPGEHDVRWNGDSALPKWREQQTDVHNAWCYAPLDEVKRNLASTGYDATRVHFVKGPVEETLPSQLPGAGADQIALLRLDTDFYESSYHELVHLYPRLAVGGVLILDDYHCWRGQQRAVQQYFTEQGIGMMLTYASTSATGVKAAPMGLSRSETAGAQDLPAQAG